jgi:hypothetical protein
MSISGVGVIVVVVVVAACSAVAVLLRSLLLSVDGVAGFDVSAVLSVVFDVAVSVSTVLVSLEGDDSGAPSSPILVVSLLSSEADEDKIVLRVLVVLETVGIAGVVEGNADGDVTNEFVVDLCVVVVVDVVTDACVVTSDDVVVVLGDEI